MVLLQLLLDSGVLHQYQTTLLVDRGTTGMNNLNKVVDVAVSDQEWKLRATSQLQVVSVDRVVSEIN